MLVHVKTPRTAELIVVGEAALEVVEVLRQHFKQVTVDHDEGDEDLLIVRDTAWHEEHVGRMTPGRVLRLFRVRENLTLEALSANTGIAKSNLSKMENGRRSIGRITARRLAEALHCDYRRFL